ncbi:MAG: hypothetical protein KatS3mg076_2572 [Candidatus Binatia bacterium]|nr:MAG: hypothetical protein KatS3mg076_2572 [Candidatus Binatia bacterium]
MEERLRRLVHRIWEAPSPFYRSRFLAAGLSPTSPLEEVLLRTGPTRREEILRDQLESLPFGTRAFADASFPVRVGKSGRAETLLALAFTQADLEREKAAGVRFLRKLGIDPGARVANALPGALATPGSLLWGDVVEELGALDVPLGAGESEAEVSRAWEVFDLVEPALLVLRADTGPRFLASAPPRERRWLRGILWLVERPETSLPDIPPGLGFDGWERKWWGVPEVASFVALSCAEGGFHVDEEILVEVWDGGRASREGQGELLLTPFGLDTPVFRYGTGVRATLSLDCGCGTGGASFR